MTKYSHIITLIDSDTIESEILSSSQIRRRRGYSMMNSKQSVEIGTPCLKHRNELRRLRRSVPSAP